MFKSPPGSPEGFTQCPSAFIPIAEAVNQRITYQKSMYLDIFTESKAVAASLCNIRSHKLQRVQRTLIKTFKNSKIHNDLQKF